jgi:hypothetical protein
MLQCYHSYLLIEVLVTHRKLIQRSDPRTINHRSIEKVPIEEGEIVLLKDGRAATTWYCAQVLEKLPDYVTVSYFTTEIMALANYADATLLKERLRSLKEVVFRKTWSIPNGSATTVAPTNSRKRSLLWTGQIPPSFLDEQLLIRNVGLSSQGKLDDTTASLATKLKIPHHVGA